MLPKRWDLPVVEYYYKSKHKFGNLCDIFQIDKKDKQYVFFIILRKKNVPEQDGSAGKST